MTSNNDNSTNNISENNKRGAAGVVGDILIMMCLIVFDQFTKNLAVLKLKGNKSFVLIKGVFELEYLENKGAAFGIMQNMKYFFLVVAALMVIFVIYSLIKLPKGGKFILMEICLLLIGSGAVGNMIDRIMNDYVVDFFYFSLINFPIFNVADIYVTVACAVLIISILFVYKEDDLSFFKIRNKSVSEDKESGEGA